MAKYGAKASEKVEKAMHERKRGALKSGSGKKVTSKKQAIAIGLSQARRAGGKVPKKKSSSRKSSGKKCPRRNRDGGQMRAYCGQIALAHSATAVGFVRATPRC